MTLRGTLWKTSSPQRSASSTRAYVVVARGRQQRRLGRQLVEAAHDRARAHQRSPSMRMPGTVGPP